MPRQNEQVNEIWMCDRGRFGWHYTESEERLTGPLIKKDGKHEKASWKEAIKLAADKLLEAKWDAVILADGWLSNEDLFNLKTLAEPLGVKALLYPSLHGGELTTKYGLTSGTNFSDLGKGSTIVVASSDLYHDAPIWYLRIKQATERGATLVVINDKETKLDRYAAHVFRYGNAEGGKAVSELKEKIGEPITAAENLIVLFGQNENADLAEACAELVKDRAGKPNNGLIGVWPRGNEQGAWELGFQPAGDLVKALSGKTVYIVAANPARNAAMLNALKGAKFIIVQELTLTATAQMAQVVLPASAFTERGGSFTSGERRVQRYYPAVPALEGTLPDYAITAAIAREIGIDMEDSSPAVLMDRIAARMPAFAGISYGKLAEVTEQWPIIGRSDVYYGGTSYQNSQGLGVHLSLANKKA
jgi:NADH-quinone oxidoreductase subunit G